MVRDFVGEFIHGITNDAKCKQAPNWDYKGLRVSSDFIASVYENYQLKAAADVLKDAIKWLHTIQCMGWN